MHLGPPGSHPSVCDCHHDWAMGKIVNNVFFKISTKILFRNGLRMKGVNNKYVESLINMERKWVNLISHYEKGYDAMWSKWGGGCLTLETTKKTRSTPLES